MERLTEWRNGHGAIVNNRENYIDKLARYEDAVEQGRMVVLPEPTPDIDFMRIFNLVMADAEGRAIVLPCKVGDSVYYLTGGPTVRNGTNFDKVEESVCTGILIERDRVQIRLRYDWKGNHGSYGVFGKTVFLTREEAEKALDGK